MKRLFIFPLLALCLFTIAASAQDFYTKEATWQQTMLTARARYQAWRADQTQGGAVTFSPWEMAGPIKAQSLADSLFPEKTVNLEAKAPDGSRVWTRRDDFVDGIVNDLPEDGIASVYLYRTITTTRPMRLTAGIGSDDGVEIRLNGAKVLFSDAARQAAADQEKVELQLVAGENKLLIKIFNRGGKTGFYFSIADDPVLHIWDQLVRDFPTESGWMMRDTINASFFAWISSPDAKAIQSRAIAHALRRGDDLVEPLRAELDALDSAATDDPRRLDLYVKACRFRKGMEDMGRVNFAALRLAVSDLGSAFPEKYVQGKDLIAKIDAAEKERVEIPQKMIAGDEAAYKWIEQLLALQSDALLSNPLLDFDRLLLVKRSENQLGLPQNWQGNCAVPSTGYDNEIAFLSPVSPRGKISTFYRPESSGFVGDVDLNFDADKMLFSMPGSNGRWQIWEIKSDGTGLRQVTSGEEPDVDNYDACYLADERITFASTRCMQGVPCVGGSNTVANLCLMDADGGDIRQLCYDQDHNWCPTMLNNGRVLYSRWEYSDTPHYFSRLLFSMNPDGTNQSEYYGSNSFWPNSIFYARPIPGSPSAVVAIISGHHGVARMGELIILDPAKGRFESDGVVQRIPGYGKKVEPVIMDTLVDDVWPKFLHPYPLSDKYFLVSCKPGPESPWGIYLVDIFDNMLLLAETPGYALFEPVPFRKTPRPPLVTDRVKLDRDDATVYLTDIYRGDGLKGVPRGAVKSLRVYEFYYCYPQMGGHINIGVEGPWDVRRILGTVPVYEDGSAHFKVPANIPIAVQPLDSEGRAIQVMRSWFVGMPGESISCIGCHEKQNMTPPATQTIAARKLPQAIEPWKGPARGFSFKRDVQPVLDKHCVGCHDGGKHDGPTRADFRRKEKNGWGNFTPSYLALHPYVRRPGPESDYHLQKPAEFHASTSELIQMLEKGHHNVKLDRDAWERLYAWIDLNVPDHGTWAENHPIPGNWHERRLEMRTKYSNRPEDPELIPDLEQQPVAYVAPEKELPTGHSVKRVKGWPLSAKGAAKLQAAAGAETRRTVDLGNGVKMDFVLIPAGEFVMGNRNGCRDEQPASRVSIKEPFWMSVAEVTCAQFQQFDARHDNGFFDQHHKDHTTPGYPAHGPNNPAIRISWNGAEAFCRWLSETAGADCSLPTEAQWEWACRAGTETPFWYGTEDTDFAPFANLADVSIKLLAVTGINPQPIKKPSPYENFLPQDARFDDGARLMQEAAKYQPNPWGLHDMHGNVAEWTQSLYRPYPYVGEDGREDPEAEGKRVVRGGSWMDRPKRATSTYRLAYEPWQPVYNVGFRVVMAMPEGGK